VANLHAIVHGDRRTRQSTLHKYLLLIGPIPAGSMFPNECRPYFDRGYEPGRPADVLAAVGNVASGAP
jgi:hypothetical protein